MASRVSPCGGMDHRWGGFVDPASVRLGCSGQSSVDYVDSRPIMWDFPDQSGATE